MYKFPLLKLNNYCVLTRILANFVVDAMKHGLFRIRKVTVEVTTNVTSSTLRHVLFGMAAVSIFHHYNVELSKIAPWTTTS